MVLLTKPPFDYLPYNFIEKFLDDNQTIEDLAKFIASRGRESTFWEWREESLKYNPKVKERNNKFFSEFWS